MVETPSAASTTAAGRALDRPDVSDDLSARRGLCASAQLVTENAPADRRLFSLLRIGLKERVQRAQADEVRPDLGTPTDVRDEMRRR
jgi:hypothetical protein